MFSCLVSCVAVYHSIQVNRLEIAILQYLCPHSRNNSLDYFPVSCPFRIPADLCKVKVAYVILRLYCACVGWYGICMTFALYTSDGSVHGRRQFLDVVKLL